MNTALVDIINALGVYVEERHRTASRTPADRRAHPRLRPRELDPDLRARLKHGPLLTLVDVSSGGALIETDARLTPGARLLLEFTNTDDGHIVTMASRVTRAEVASLNGGVHYRGGCAFTDLLPLDALPARHAHRNGHRSTSEERLERLRRLQVDTVATADPILSEMVGGVVAMAQDGRPPHALMTWMEQSLRQRVPLLAVTIGAPARVVSAAGHALSFDLPAAKESERTQVVFRPAGRLDDWQVRLLEAGASVLGLLHAWSDAAGKS